MVTRPNVVATNAFNLTWNYYLSYLFPPFGLINLQGLGFPLQGQGFPEEVSNILLSSWRKSSARQYESAWRSWSGWCDFWQINCFSASIKNILTYFAHPFHEKALQYHTINVQLQVSNICIPHIPRWVWSQESTHWSQNS